MNEVDSLSVSFWCQATLPEGTDHEQFLFSSLDHETARGFACFLDGCGCLRARIGGSGKIQEVAFSIKLSRYQWYHINFCIDRTTRKVQLRAQAKSVDIGQPSVLHQQEEVVADIPQIASNKDLVIAGDSNDIYVAGYPIKSASFNGKIGAFEMETLSKEGDEMLLDLDFALEIPTDGVRDVSGKQRHGNLINAPARGVTGHDWDASQNDWTRASYGYNAIHFHDDDLDDAGWETSLELRVPPDLRSGCYGVYVDDGVTQDIVPFFVRPDLKRETISPVALIMPTFTYMGKSLKTMEIPSNALNISSICKRASLRRDERHSFRGRKGEAGQVL